MSGTRKLAVGMLVMATAVISGILGYEAQQVQTRNRPQLYRQVYIATVDAAFSSDSTAQCEHVSVDVPGQQPLGKRYRVTVEELEQ